MPDRRISREELEAFWRGDKDTFQRLYQNRQQQIANNAEKQGKEVTYVPNDGTSYLPEVVITSSKNILKPVTRSLSYEELADNLITAAGFVPGLDTFADVADIGNSWRKGDKAGVLWGIAGLGLPGSGKMYKFAYNKLKSPLKTFYLDVYPSIYKYVDKSEALMKDIKTFFLTDITENPLRAVKRNRLYRRRWNNPKINIKGPEEINFDVNSKENAMDLLKSRYINGGKEKMEVNRGSFTLASSEDLWNNVEHKDYITLKDAWNLSDSKSLWTKLVETPRIHYGMNIEPGALIHHKKPIVFINYNLLKKQFPKWDIDAIRAHEMDHALNFEFLDPYPKNTFNYSHLPKRLQGYLGKETELSARGTLLKNYFGFTNPNQVITADMLKYAANNYVKDTNMDNNMQLFFSGIKDWEAAAEWLSKYSLKKGGKL